MSNSEPSLGHIACSEAVLIDERNGLKCYKPQFKLIHSNSQYRLRAYEFGETRPDKRLHQILLVGLLSYGKTHLINLIANYIYGIALNDAYRLQIISDAEVDEERTSPIFSTTAKSKTSWVTSYTFHWRKGFAIPYSLTVIDTPGFGDVRGVIYDDDTVLQIDRFIRNKQLLPIQEISSIGLVIAESETPISKEEFDIVDHILSIFGKDMAPNLSVLLTFFDDSRPVSEPDAAELMRFEKCKTFKMNNSALYVYNDRRNSGNTWAYGFKVLGAYFNSLIDVHPTNLALTIDVLNQRKVHSDIRKVIRKETYKGLDMLDYMNDRLHLQMLDLPNMYTKYQKQKLKVLQYIECSEDVLQKLSDMALRSSYLHSNEHCFDIMVQYVKYAFPYVHGKERIAHITHLKEIAIILKSIHKNNDASEEIDNNVVHWVSDYEAEVAQSIEHISKHNKKCICQ